jgi:hypothetical protein
MMMAHKKKAVSNKPRNFVHLHGLTFNHGEAHRDKRKESRRGIRKHKAAWSKDQSGFFNASISATTI